jgi:hypothetical protein
MTPFTVKLKSLHTCSSSAIGFFLEDGPIADTALLHSVCSEITEWKDFWLLRNPSPPKKIQVFKCIKMFISIIFFVFALSQGIQSIKRVFMPSLI